LDLSVARGIPIGNGIITVENEAQAKARASVDDQDKGGGAVRAALTLVGLKKRLGKR
jgi:6,7-dimethyl-8-ribityllumazine synthase